MHDFHSFLLNKNKEIFEEETKKKQVKYA